MNVQYLKLIISFLIQSDDLHNPMLTALLDDKADFVRLFLENGLSMREFLTVEHLCVLYRSVSFMKMSQ